MYFQISTFSYINYNAIITSYKINNSLILWYVFKFLQLLLNILESSSLNQETKTTHCVWLFVSSIFNLKKLGKLSCEDTLVKPSS